MVKNDVVKLVAALSAAAGIAVVFAGVPAKAQTAMEQQQMTTEPAQETSGACNFFEYHSSWDPVACWDRGGATTATQSSMLGEQPLAVPQATEEESSGSCNFSKYHSSWDPTVC